MINPLVKIRYLSTAVAAAAIWVPCLACAQECDDDAPVREQPVIQPLPSGLQHVSFDKYPFLDMGANVIKMNGASWHGLAEKFDRAAAGEGIVSVVHIGDSHIQADGNTGKIRNMLQSQFGNAGRGLMIPFRIAGTNQPLDYSITTRDAVTVSKLLRTPWPTQMGFTGIAVAPQYGTVEFDIRSPSSFGVLNVYGDGNIELKSVMHNGIPVDFGWQNTDFGGVLSLPANYTDLMLKFGGRDNVFFGFDARGAVYEEEDGLTVSKPAPGVLYHSIGNNGAAFSSYNLVGGVGKSLQALNPDLVVLSLGTNEAFGRITDNAFESTVDRMVRDIRHHNPGALILLTTPAECQRSVYTWSRRGKRRRARRVRSYAVNSNVRRMRDVLLQYGAENNIPVYDFYAVAGGAGASGRWLQSKLLANDRIHRTWTGYYLDGALTYQAIAAAISEAGLHKKVLSVAELDATPPADLKPTVSTSAAKRGKKTTKKKRRASAGKKRR